jgi:hypothetical protein
MREDYGPYDRELAMSDQGKPANVTKHRMCALTERFGSSPTRARRRLADRHHDAGPSNKGEERGHSMKVIHVHDVEGETAAGPTWTTRDGRRIPIAKLEDEHLGNIIKKLHREAKARLPIDQYPIFDWEMAENATASPSEWLQAKVPIWNVLLDEVLKRGLEPFQDDAELIDILEDESA